MFEGNQYIVIVKISERKISGITCPGMSHDESGTGQRFGTLEDLANRHAFPGIIIATPCGDAMNIGGECDAWQFKKLFPC